MIGRALSSGWFKTGAGVLAGAVVASVVAVSITEASGAAPNTITGCINNVTGQILILSDPTGYTNESGCPTKGTHELTWAQQGVQGPQGAQGATGSPGAQGTMGSPGVSTLQTTPSTIGTVTLRQPSHGKSGPIDISFEPVSVTVGSGPKVTPVVVTKKIDTSSPALLQALTRGSVFTSVAIVLNGVNGEPVARYSLKNVLIVRSEIAGVDGVSTQTLTLRYQAIQLQKL
jgi:hypothetical protein